MKALIRLSFITVVFCFSVILRAQTKNRIPSYIGYQFEMSQPFGRFAEKSANLEKYGSAETGVCLPIILNIGVAGTWSIRLRFAIMGWSMNNKALQEEANAQPVPYRVNSGSWSSVPIMAGLSKHYALNRSENIIFYLYGMGGVAFNRSPFLQGYNVIGPVYDVGDRLSTAMSFQTGTDLRIDFGRFWTFLVLASFYYTPLNFGNIDWGPGGDALNINIPLTAFNAGIGIGIIPERITAKSAGRRQRGGIY